MIMAGKKIKDSKILIMGVTFKENCPDMRNSKVMDIFLELQGFGADVDVYDPWAEPLEAKVYYGKRVVNEPLGSDVKYDAIVVAVGHQQFKEWVEADYKKISVGEPITIDVKNVVPNPSWRL
jgi:UDP-N-acetyl-D-galactosamine dehydrogenase